MSKEVRKASSSVIAGLTAGALIGLATQPASGEQQAFQTPQPTDSSSLHLPGGTPVQRAIGEYGVTFGGVNIGKETSEAVVPENPFTFTLDGKAYWWAFNNGTNGTPPNNPERIVATISVKIDNVDGKPWQPQESMFPETKEGRGADLGILGWAEESATKQAYVVVAVSDVKGHARLRLLRVNSEKPDDYSSHVVFTGTGLSDGTTKGFWNPTKIVNDGVNHYVQIMVRGSIDPANDGERRVTLDASGNFVGNAVRVSEIVTPTPTATVTATPTVTATAEPTPAIIKPRAFLPAGLNSFSIEKVE